MPTTYSTSLRLSLMATGENVGTWGTITNTNLGDLLEQAISGYQSIAMSDANKTLTALDGTNDEARNAVLNMTGTLTAARAVIIPAVEKLYVVRNATTGGFGITVRTSSGTGPTIPNGSVALVYCDGTNVTQATGSYNPTTNTITATITGNVTGNLTGNVTGNLTGDVTGNVTGTAANVTGTVAVANGGTGSTTQAGARTNLGLGSIATQAANSVSITGGSITGITDLAVADGGTGASTAAAARVNLLPSYATNAAKVLAVNAGATDVEWVAASGGSVSSVSGSGGTTGLTLTGGPITTSGTLTLGGTLNVANGGTGATSVTNARINLLPAYTGNAGRVLAVNAGATDLEWISPGGGGTVTSVAVSGGTTGLTTSGGPITAAGTITLAGTLALANGGTGATTAANARTNLGLAIGTDVQAYSAYLGALAGLSTTGIEVRTGAGTAATRTITGSTDRITVTNGDGVTANPTIDIASTYTGQTSIVTLGTITSGSWNAGVIGVNYGGTGMTSYTIGDLVYASGVTTLAKLSGVATGNALISGGVGAAPTYGKIGLTTHISGTLGVGNGGTGITTVPVNGALLIGNSSGYTSATLTAGTGVSVTNGAGSITVANTGVLSVSAGQGLTASTTSGAATVALDVSTSSVANNTSFPIGTYISAYRANNSAQNASAVTLYAENLTGAVGYYAYVPGGSSLVTLAGTWRARGVNYTTSSGGCCPVSIYWVLYQRTA